MRACPSCGEENPERARFCLACGTALAESVAPTREERKVVTVLFADLVGFTGRAERLDPEEVRAVLAPYHARLRAELERFGGTVEKFIGDAVMAVFGAPAAHEDDPERAVRAALAIREALGDDADLRVRIGITTGEALVTIGSRPLEGEGMAAGDVVNTAARLQAAAPVDGILVDRTTYRATERALVYRDAEPVRAKGKEEPIPVWEALEPRSRFGVDWAHRARAPLIGRDRELELLVGALDRARSERSVQLVTLVGVPGMGKSRLVWELSQVVEDDPEVVLWRQGRSLPYGEGITFWALGEMVKAQAGVLETDSAGEAEEKLAEAVADTLGGDEDRAWVEGHLRHLLGLHGLEGGSDLEESFAAWRRFFEALADRAPLVLVFEDLHWADGKLLDFVDHLSDWATGVPLLVVGTARPELLTQRPSWGGGKPNAVTLSLSPLADDDTARLLAALLDRAVLPAEAHGALIARAGGNPLYAEEYTRMLAERGTRTDLELPETVQGIIAARLDALSAEEKELLQDAAVVGKVFWLGALTAITPRGRAEAERLLHGLERRELVHRQRQSSVAAESEYAFRHILVRDVAYGQIPRAERADKHRSTAEWIGGLGRPEDHAEMVAHHHLEAVELLRAAGRDLGSLAEQARAAFLEAGERAFALEAYRAAAGFFRHALDLWPDDGARPRVVLQLGLALANASLGGREELEAARDALLAAGERESAAEAEARIGGVLWSELDHDGAFAHMNRAMELVAGAPTSPAKVAVYSQSARMLALAEEREPALAVGLQALEMAAELGLERQRATILSSSVALVRAGAGDPQGLADFEHAIELAEALNSPEVVRAQLNLASVLADQGRLEEAFAIWAAGRRNAERFGEVYRRRWLLAEQAFEFYWRGLWDDAQERADDFIGETEAGEKHYMVVACLEVRALMRLARGEHGAAGEDAQRELEVARQIKDPQALYPALATFARVAAESGREDEARETLRELSALWEKRPYAPGNWITNAALARPRPDGSDPLLPADSGLRSLWLEAGEAFWRGAFAEAAAVYASIGSRPDEAYARLRAGEELARAGRQAEADAELRAALVFFTSVRARWYAERAESLLAASA